MTEKDNLKSARFHTIAWYSHTLTRLLQILIIRDITGFLRSRIFGRLKEGIT